MVLRWYSSLSTNCRFGGSISSLILSFRGKKQNPNSVLLPGQHLAWQLHLHKLVQVGDRDIVEPPKMHYKIENNLRLISNENNSCGSTVSLWRSHIFFLLESCQKHFSPSFNLKIIV